MQFGEPELLEEDGVVTRYQTGRSGLCSKCVRNHRTYMSNKLGMSLLEEWLTNPVHRLEWSRRVVAGPWGFRYRSTIHAT
jgi:hypothetical protein